MLEMLYMYVAQYDNHVAMEYWECNLCYWESKFFIFFNGNAFQFK